MARASLAGGVRSVPRGRRRRRGRLGAPKAVTAAAHEPARILSNLTRYGVASTRQAEGGRRGAGPRAAGGAAPAAGAGEAGRTTAAPRGGRGSRGKTRLMASPAGASPGT